MMEAVAGSRARLGTSTLIAATVLGLVAASAAKAGEADRPVLVCDRFVNPIDGQTVGRVPGGSPYERSDPLPGKTGWFSHNNLAVDAATMTATTDGVMAVSGRTVRDSTISLLGEGGAVRWTHPFFDSLRPPVWAEEVGIVVVPQIGGLVGISDASGEEVWRAKGPNDRLLAAHGLVVATDRESIVARRLTDGSDAWRDKFPSPEKTDPEPTIAAGDLFLVGNRGGGSDGWTRAYSTDGSLQFVLDGETVHGARQIAPGGDVIVVTESESKPGPFPGRVGNYYVTTSSRTARLNRNGQEIWHVAPPIPADEHTPAGIYQLPDGSILVETHVSSSDTGVDVAKIDPVTGAVAWRVTASRLGVGHSFYWQYVYIELRGSEFVLVSQALGGHFVERRTIADGALVHRWQFPPEYPDPGVSRRTP
ncbi:MAG TPA: PQQ-binding-like beta-propeller repeat protein [Candidatus Binatia bacterium]|jgi:hypothetical protein